LPSLTGVDKIYLNKLFCRETKRGQPIRLYFRETSPDWGS
jgi:hypothetical protein